MDTGNDSPRLVPLSLALAAVLVLGTQVALDSTLARALASLAALALGGAAALVWRRVAARRARATAAQLEERLAALEARRRLLEQRLRRLIDAPRQATLVLDPEGVVVEAGAATGDVFGHSSEALVGVRLEALVDDGAPRAEESAGRWAVWEARGIGAVGAERPLELAATLVGGAELPTSRFLVARDLSRREQAIRQARRAHDEAEQALRTRSEFLANMSHEIRTPMNGVLGMLALLSEEELTEDQREIVDHVRRSAASLLELVTDLLDLSRLTTGGTALEEVEFDALGLVEDITIMLAEARANPGVDVIVRSASELECFVLGDSGRIRQVVSNLVNNALKFTRRGHIIVSVETVARDDGRLTLSVAVEDTGIGIASEDQQRVFERFRQLDGSATRQYGGAGLGLAIARDLARLMGGDIGVRSEPGSGSCFELRCVVGRAALGDGRPKAPNLEGRRALIATRAAAQGEAVASTLSELGARCEVVSDTPGLRDALDGQDVLLADTALVAELRRGHEGLTLPPIIGLSAVQERLTVARRATLGLASALSRPVRLSRCGAVVARVIAEAGALDGRGASPGHFEARVLLVEGNPVNRLVAKKLLSDLGCVVTLAEDEGAALAAARSTTFDLVLMDCHLPKMGGAEMARALRREGGHCAELPIIGLSGGGDGVELQRLFEAGVDGHLATPMTRESLASTLSRLVAVGRINPG